MTAVQSFGASLLFGVAVAAATLARAAAPVSPPGAPAAETVAAITSTPQERLQVYRDFRALFDAQKFSDAAPLAERLVTLIEAATGLADATLATPLVNLGTTQYQLSDYSAAEASYLRAVKIIEQASGGFSKSLVGPLRGLGLTYLAAGQPQAAIEPLRRAVDITRKVDGLFNEGQLELLDPLVRSYSQVNQIDDAEREQIYGYRVSENRFGRNSAEVVPSLEKLARWYSDVGRNTTARQYFSRSLGILQKTLGKSDPRMISSLRGIADTYRLEYIYGPETTGDESTTAGANTGTVGGSVTTTPPSSPEYNPAGAKPDPSGETALRTALAIAEAAKPNVDTALHASILIELGDWLSLDNERRDALESYRRAWPLLKNLPPPQNAALAEPAQILYRQPLAGYRSQHAKPENIVEGFVDVEFTVTTEGKVIGEHTVGKSASDTQEHAVLSAIRKARYRPRFEQGEPVEANAVRYHQPVFSVKAGATPKKT
jgi:TonB family protein